MNEIFSRTELLLGSEAMDRLRQAHVAVFGVGGVGGFTVEALARSGVGHLTIVDKDQVDITNLNRQIIATLPSVGRDKVDVMRERILSINPDCTVTARKVFYLPETAGQFHFADYDYVVDAVDTVTAKIALVLAAEAAGVPIISSMGAGNKLDPTRFEIADIYETSVCPLARVMRRELKKRRIGRLKVVYSKEVPRTPLTGSPDAAAAPDGVAAEPAGIEAAGNTKPELSRKAVPGSIAFVPSAAGLILASAVVRDLIS